MITIKTIDSATFSINGIPYQKGSGRIVKYGNVVSIVEYQNDTRNYTGKVDFSNWRDQADQPFANVDDLILYLGQTILL